MIGLAVATPALARTSEGPNLTRPDFFLVVIDTARADAYQTYNPGLRVGAALAALARDGIVLERLRAPAPWTRPSVATLLTGLPPARHQVGAGLDRLSPDLATLPSLLKAAGYRTLGWSGNTQVLPVFGFGVGFDEYADLAGRGTRHHPEARTLFEAARGPISKSPVGGGFYYIHVVDPHYPYEPPREQESRVEELASASDLGRHFRPLSVPRKKPPNPNRSPVRYLAEVRDADTELGRFLGFLRSEKRYDPALILVVSDHGEELLDHGGEGHGHALYEELLRVPGVLKLPGNRRAGERVARDVELHDLAATVARWLPIDPPPGSPGVDALAPGAANAPHAYLSHHHGLAAVRHGDWKLIVDFERDAVELYDLRRDPYEERDLARREPERVAILRATLDRIQARHAPGWHLRGCGCRDETATLSFRLEGVQAAPVRLELETSDRLAASGAASLAVTLSLEPQRLSERGARTGRPLDRADRDEILIPRVNEEGADTGDPVLRPARAGESLRVALGSGDARLLDGDLELSQVREQAAVRPSEPVRCGAALDRGRTAEERVCRPTLHVWYSEPPVALSESELDPEVAERLRALGYEW